MSADKQPGWIAENELATSMGFTCVKDTKRGGKLLEWSSFVIGDWHVWSIASWHRGDQHMAWQVARLCPNGLYREHYTRRHLKLGEYGISVPGFWELKDALAYAKEKANGSPAA